MPRNNKPTQVDNAIIVLDEKIANVFYRVILVCSLELVLIGLVMTEPVPLLFGFAFVVIGILGMALCIHKINQSARMVSALAK